MASSRRLQQLRSYDGSDEDDCPGDYLQDPSLWSDQLPQPYRMLDRLLHELLLGAWEMIEWRETERRREAAKVRIPEIEEWSRVALGDELAYGGGGVCSVRCGREGCVFVRGSDGFSVIRAPSAVEAGEEGNWEIVAQSGDLEMDVRGLDVVFSRGTHFCAAVCSRELKIFALIKDKLLSICSIPSQSEDHRIVSGHFSLSCSHLGLTVAQGEAAVHLDLYQVPLDSWHSELSQYMDRLAAAVANALHTDDPQTNQVNVQEMVYSKPSLLAMIQPPKEFSPCPTNDPAAAFQRVKEGKKGHLPTGDLHTLTTNYFESRRREFVAKYPDMADQYDDILAQLNYSNSLPTYHFLHYMESWQRARPCYVAVWWEKHTQLFIYTLPTEVSKNPTTPQIYWLIPHASAIVATSVSDDTKLLAVGQATGVVSVYNLQTELCERVTMVASDPDGISCMEWFDSVLGVGTEEGQLMALSTGEHQNEPPFSLGQRVKKQMEMHSSLFISSGYEIEGKIIGLRVNSALPSVLSSVHADGSVILWSIDDREALCKLCLPSAALSEQCCFTSDGSRLLATAGEGAVALISFDLSSPASSRLLSKHWKDEKRNHHPLEDLKEDICTGNIMEVVERELQKYLKQRVTDREIRLARYSKYWTDLDGLLKTHK